MYTVGRGRGSGRGECGERAGTHTAQCPLVESVVWRTTTAESICPHPKSSCPTFVWTCLLLPHAITMPVPTWAFAQTCFFAPAFVTPSILAVPTSGPHPDLTIPSPDFLVLLHTMPCPCLSPIPGLCPGLSRLPGPGVEPGQQLHVLEASRGNGLNSIRILISPWAQNQGRPDVGADME